MTGFSIFGLIFSIMYTLHPGGPWVTAQPPIYQTDKELSVDVGNSATLRCCVSEKAVKTIAWFKQRNLKKPQIIVTVNTTDGEKFHSGSKMSSLKIERSLNCINLTIFIVMHSDVAMYYCALMEPNNLVFADGTYLKLKGEEVTIAPETSKPTQLDHSVVCEVTLPGNNININSQEITVLGLGAALGLCVLLIFGLFYFILKRRKCDKRS
ncbi:uncharacterized protein LOC128512646 isoform X2 [Clarias gariepinus]|uniref:uncharacterized protein LOC128512646 isoform X2 n=1 Tax=Clarias gariepinus TaxID=13013 RepID=UPI00234D8639|nr:uncharacterized protein LOC128512646 isoform X2 [Clarias gariepinus]